MCYYSFYNRASGLVYSTTYVMSMIGLEASVTMGNWKIMTFHGLTEGIKILKPYRKLSLTHSFLQVLSIMSVSGK